MNSSITIILSFIIIGVCLLAYLFIKSMIVSSNTKQASITNQQYLNIIRLLKALEMANSVSEKKKLRHQLQNQGYYISEHGANTIVGFKKLIEKGEIDVKDFTTGSVKISRSSTSAKSNPTRKEVYSFPPIVDESSEILILGTAPGIYTLATGEYYAQSGNIFWTVIQHLYNEGRAFSSYEEIINCVKANHIALWDTLKACDRKGSTDKKSFMRR